MKAKAIVIIIFFIAGFYGCRNKSSNNKQAENQNFLVTESLKNRIIREGKNISQSTVSVFQKHLKQAINAGGIDSAINYCHSKAMFLTDSLSGVYSVKIKRMAKKNRNPFNFLDKQGEKVYNEYQKELASAQPLKPKILINEKGNPVYYAPIRLGKDVCLKCHGTPKKEITEKRMILLKKYYPEDKAVNFKKGDLRGVWAITFDKASLEKKN